ncbi:MAG: hypothetical protein ACLP1X_15740 [Polyangiaceae bacterium]
MRLAHTAFLVAVVDACGSDGDSASGMPAPDASAYAYFYANPTEYGAVYAVTAGAATTVQLAKGQVPHNIGAPFAFDGHHVYYGDVVDAGPGLLTSLVALPSTGGHPSTLVSGLHTVTALAVDAATLYFVDTDPLEDGGTREPILGAVPLAGGPIRTLTSPPSNPTSLAVDARYVYWTDQSGSVSRVPLDGGAVETLAQGEPDPGGIHVDATGVYWFDEGHAGTDCVATDGTVMVLLPGSSSPSTLASSIAGLRSLAASQGDVYWTASGPGCNLSGVGTGSLSKLARSETTAGTLVSGLTGADNLFIDATTVYFTILTDWYNGVMAASAVAK